jgi:hypothetical protein
VNTAVLVLVNVNAYLVHQAVNFTDVITSLSEW